MPTSREPRLTLRELAGAALERPGARASGARVRAWCGSCRAGVALVILCLAVYLPGLMSIPPVDRDESRFAQASRTMLETGDYVVPRIQGKARLNKPPLIYWLQAASARVLGDGPGTDGMGEWGNGNIWVFRVPSVLCAIGTVLLTWRLGLRMFDARAAVLGAALLGVCPMVVWDAHQARADQLLLLTTVGAMGAMFRSWKWEVGGGRSGGNGWAPWVSALMFWGWIGLGVLAKGPVCPMIAGLAIVMLSVASRNVRWVWSLRPLAGVVIVAAMVGPWVWMIGREVGWNEYWSVVVRETLGRSAEPAEGHWGPPGYHLLLLSVLMWPGSLTTAASMVRAWKRGMCGRAMRIGRAPEAFLFAWIVPAWIVFELIATKLPHYTMPLYPAIALLSARGAMGIAGKAMKNRGLGARAGLGIWTGIGVLGLGLGLLALAFMGMSHARWGNLPLLFSAFIALWLVVSFVWMASDAAGKGKIARAFTFGLIAMVAWSWSALGWVFPQSPGYWASDYLARSVHRAAPDSNAAVALVDYGEDSVVFLLRGGGERVSPDDLAAWRSAHPGGLVVVSSHSASELALQSDASMVLVFQFEGYNYSVTKGIAIRMYGPRPRGD